MGILIVEDDSVTSIACMHSLSSFAKVWTADSIAAAKKIMSNQKIELIILDISLPDGDGFQFYNELTAKSGKTIPVIFLTSKNEVHSKVVAFSIGATDYISKPFDSIEFQARVKAHWNRLNSKERFVDWSIYRLDQDSLQLYIFDGIEYKSLSCTGVELKILSTLLKTPGKIFSRDELIDRVWGNGHFISERNIDSHIARLRKKIFPLGGNIEAIRGLGYRLVEKVQKVG